MTPSRIVCIIGPDGSGKTTLSDMLVSRLGRDHSADRVWLGSESYLMAPVRFALALIWRPATRLRARGRGASVSADYRGDLRKKNAVADRFPWAVRLYVQLVLLDYRAQLRWKLARRSGDSLLVADRYLFDVMVNLGLTLAWGPEQVVAETQIALSRVRLPETRAYVRVPPEVSLARKDDIGDIEYLRSRFAYYDALARAFGFEVLDGTEPLEDNADRLEDLTRSALAKPYVHYVHANNIDVGGADNVLVSMAQHMRSPADEPDQGFRTSVSLRLCTAAAANHAAAGTPVIVSPFLRPQLSQGVAGVVRLLVRGPGTVWYFRRLFRREAPDLVHVNDLYDFLPAVAAKSCGIPVVYHLRMIQSHRVVRRAFRSLVVRLSRVSVSVSGAVRDAYLLSSKPAHAALGIHDLGNAALMSDRPGTPSAARPAGLPDRGRLVVMVGRVEPWKGQDVFLDAVRRLGTELRAAHSFVVVGGDVPGKEDYADRIRHECSELGVVHLGGRSDVPQILATADIAVHASTTPDPFPGVVIESMLSGAATVASAGGGVLEMISGPGEGATYPMGDARALAARLDAWLSSATPPRELVAGTAATAARRLVDPVTVDRAVRQAYLRALSNPDHQQDEDQPR